MEAQPQADNDDKTQKWVKASLDETAAAPGDNFAEGEIIGGRYQVISIIGEGGNGVVYRVRQIFLERDMALKTLNVGKDGDTVIKRFQQEAKTSNSIEHPNLIKVLDFGMLQDNRPFLVMELAEGNSLAQVFRQKGSINQDELISIFSKVLEGLAYAHDNGIIHRDLKPSNIMYVEKDNKIDSVKIIDFGIAKITGLEGGEIQSLTRTGEIFGSPLYMSPEQCLGLKVDQRSDIYSLGCVMFEALTGAPPFVGETALLTLMKHTTENAPSLKEGSFGGNFSNELEQIIAKMLKKAPLERFQNAREIATALLSLRNTDQAKIPPNIKNPPQKQDDAKSWRLLLAILLALVLSAVFMFNHIQTQTVPKQVIERSKSPDNLKDQNRFFMPLSTVHRGINGALMRQCHFPQGLGKLTTVDIDTGVVSRESRTDFELPEKYKYRITVDTALPIPNAKMLSGFDTTAIVKLEVDDTELDKELIFSVSEMKELADLSFKSTNFSDKDIVYLNKLPKLQALHLEGSKVTTNGLLKLKSLNNLIFLTLDNLEDITKLLDALKHNKVLQSLTLINCEIDSHNIEKLLAFPKLITLDLAGNSKITEQDIQKLIPLEKLESIDLRNSELPPSSYLTFKKFPHLRNVFIETNKWKAADYRNFEKMMGNCKVNFFRKALEYYPSDDDENQFEDASGIFESLTRPEKK